MNEMFVKNDQPHRLEATKNIELLDFYIKHYDYAYCIIFL